MKVRSSIDLGLAVLSAGAGVWATYQMPLAAHALLASTAVLLAPGYALVAALWPQRIHDRAIVAVLSILASLAIDIAVGLVVDLRSAGFTPSALAVPLAIVTLVLCAVALGRRIFTASQPRATRKRARLRRNDLLGLSCAVVVAVIAVVAAAQGAQRADHKVAFTQLYLLPDPSSSHDVVVGVHSHEPGSVTFRLVVKTSDGGENLLTVPSLRLDDGQTDERSIMLPAGVASSTVSVQLYRDTSSTPYRSVSLGH